MKKNILIVLALLFSVQSAFAAITVKGRVFDKSTGHPMEYATVRACTLPDSTFVTGCITEPTGAFELQLEKGRYVLEVQYMGFIAAFKNVTLDGTKSLVDVGKINLSPDSRMLSEVNVVAEQSTYEMTLDKRVFNVGKDVANTSGNAIEGDFLELGDKAHILHLKHIVAFFEFHRKVTRRVGDAARHKGGVGQGAGTHGGIFHGMTRRVVIHMAFHRDGGKGKSDAKQ